MKERVSFGMVPTVHTQDGDHGHAVSGVRHCAQKESIGKGRGER